MSIPEIIIWWYTPGWSLFVKKNRALLASTVDFFSMSSLLHTLFKPYRQISAETANAEASLEMRFHMFTDRLVSRIVGFFSRLVLLIAGTILIIIGGIICFALIILWPLIPFAPIIGIVLTILGVTL